VGQHAPPGIVLDFNSLYKSPFLGFRLILKNLTDCCKNFETGMDLCLHACCLPLSWLCIVGATCISEGVTLFVGLPVPACWLHLCDKLNC